MKFTPWQDKLRELGGDGTEGESRLRKIEIAGLEVETWFPSAYPPEYSSLKKIHICEFCLKYTKTAGQLKHHMVCAFILILLNHLPLLM